MPPPSVRCARPMRRWAGRCTGSSPRRSRSACTEHGHGCCSCTVPAPTRPRPERTGERGRTAQPLKARRATMSDDTGFSAQKPISVFLVDDHEVVRRGVQDLLDAEPDIEVVGDAGTADHALARGPALRPDVAILDVRLPDGDGITVCRELRSRMPELA